MQKCDGCGETTTFMKVEGNELCQNCKTIADILIHDPEKIARIGRLAGIDITSLAELQERSTSFSGLPEVLDAVRFRTRDRDLNKWYVSVSEIKGQPVEIFASTAFDRDQHLQSRISNLTTITRLISMILRHVFMGEVLTLEKTLKQLDRSSRQPNDLPDMLSQVLRKYASNRDTSADVDDPHPG